MKSLGNSTVTKGFRASSHAEITGGANMRSCLSTWPALSSSVTVVRGRDTYLMLLKGIKPCKSDSLSSNPCSIPTRYAVPVTPLHRNLGQQDA